MHLDYAALKQKMGGKLYVEGPVSIYEFKSKPGSGLNKHIYLFGEVHIKDNTCESMNLHKSDFVKFSQLLNDAFLDNPNKIIDVMTEVSYFAQKCNIESHTYDYRIDRITSIYPSTIGALKLFERCSPTLGKKINYKLPCPYKNIRFHQADVRHMYYDSMSYHSEFSRYYYYDLFTTVNKYNNEIPPESIADFELLLEKKFIDFIKSYYETAACKILKIDKQIKNVQNNNIKNKLLALKDTWIHNNKLNYIHNDLLIAFENRHYSDVLKYLFSYIHIGSMHLMDLYTLGRLFRTFVDGTEINNVVIMAGCGHIQKYADFLENSGMFDLVYKKDKQLDPATMKYNQCVDISGLKLPMFSQEAPTQEHYGY